MYCRALLELLRLQSKNIDKITDIFELQSWQNPTTTNLRMLGAIKFYDMSAILQSVHIVLDDGTRYYMNNYTDWDTYNTVYNDNFFINKVKKAKQYQRSC